MNHLYLMQHISYHLHTLVRRCTPEGVLLDSYCARAQFKDQFSTEELTALFQSFSADNPVSQQEIPLLLLSGKQTAYALIPCPGFLFLIGPVGFSQPVYLKNQYTPEHLDDAWLKTVPVCEFSDFTTDVLLAFNLYQETVCTENTLLLASCICPETGNTLHRSFSELVFENREYGKIHNPYDQELREFASIESGDLEQLERSLAEDYPGEVGTLAKNPLRQAQNRGIVVITLASRAAIRGGLVPEIAFSLSDSYIQKIEECRDIPAVFHLFHTAEYEYAQMVKDINAQKEGISAKDRNPHINKCKDYIFSHLHGKITVQEIADALGLNANYLSGLFRRYEKVSLSAFIRREKISLTKNLLVYSRYSYSEIATYLGFSSQSHLGKYFKESTGMTLHQYRDVYGVKEFDSLL